MQSFAGNAGISNPMASKSRPNAKRVYDGVDPVASPRGHAESKLFILSIRLVYASYIEFGSGIGKLAKRFF